jgi:hypothetical protein
MVQLKHNYGNISYKLHMKLIQSKDAREERLLRNWERHRAIEHTKQRVKVAEVAEATELRERQIYHHGTTQTERTDSDCQMTPK